MKQTAAIISTYAADISGICSAMYELGGMTVMHDASGCNSTYNTHDEPRWYDMDSLVFISGLSETEAMLGDDDKLIHDIVTAAEELQPAFITLGGTPIPMMMGTDFPAVARQIERETGIQTFGIDTDGMHSYISGISKAYAILAEKICLSDVKKDEKLSINILGATPLDFSVNGTVQAMKRELEKQGVQVHSIWTMDSQNTENLFLDIQTAGAAHVNLIVSSCGIKAAKILWERFQIPYVIGAPCGEKITEKIVEEIKRIAAECEIQDKNKGEAALDGKDVVAKKDTIARDNAVDMKGKMCRNLCKDFPESKIIIIGESITALSLANALFEENGKGAKVLCAVDTENELLSDGCIYARDEAELIPYLNEAEVIIADPMYRPICPDSAKFVELPHEAFSGRIYRTQMPELVTGLNQFIESNNL